MGRLFTSIMATALVVLCVSAQAVEMEVSAGFGGICKYGAWTPITVRIKNATGDKMSGNIAVLDPVTEQPTPYLTPFEVSSSEKRYTHYIQMIDNNGDVDVALIPNSGWKKQKVKTTVTTVDDNGVLIVAAGPQRATLNFLSNEKIKAWALTNNSNPGQAPGQKTINTIFTGLVDPTFLPDRPLGYDGVALLALSEFSPQRVDPKQLTAIKMWVSSGGTLVVNGGPNYQSFQNDFYADILPLTVTGATQLPNLSSVASRFAQALPLGNVALSSGTLKPGADAMVIQNAIPLISSWEYGLGRVYFLAFDYSSTPFKGWDGNTAMWKSFINEADTRFPIASPASFGADDYGRPAQFNHGGHNIKNYRKVYNRSMAASGNAIETLTGNLPSVSTPSFEIILCYLIAYLFCLVPLNYFVFTKKKRELAWITTPAIIIVFTLGAYGIGYAMKGGKLVLKTISVMESGPGTRYASQTSYSGLFSPSRRSYEVEVSDPFTVVSEASQTDDNGNQTKSSRDANILAADTTTIPDVKMDMWSIRTFRSESACDMGGQLTANIQSDPVTMKVKGFVRNDTNFDIKDASILVDGRFAILGNINRKSTKSIDTKTSNSQPFEITSMQQQKSPDSPEVMRRSILSAIIPTIRSDGGTALIGWTEESSGEVKLARGREENIRTNILVFWLPSNGGVNR